MVRVDALPQNKNCIHFCVRLVCLTLYLSPIRSFYLYLYSQPTRHTLPEREQKRAILFLNENWTKKPPLKVFTYRTLNNFSSVVFPYFFAFCISFSLSIIPTTVSSHHVAALFWYNIVSPRLLLLLSLLLMLLTQDD